MKLNDVSALIVSPDTDFASNIEDLLETGSLSLIFKAADQADIYQTMKIEKIDFVLIDDSPPDMDGISLTRKMRKDPACPNNEVNIFVLTAQVGNIQRSLEVVNAGAHELFSKPISADRILSRIHANIVEPREFIKTQKYAGPDRRLEGTDGENLGRRAGDNSKSTALL